MNQDEAEYHLQLLREATEIIDDLLIYIKMIKGKQLPQNDGGIGRALEHLARMHELGQPITMTWAMLLREKGLLEPFEEEVQS